MPDEKEGDPYGDLVRANQETILAVQRRCLAQIVNLAREAMRVHPHYPDSYPPTLKLIEDAQRQLAAVEREQAKNGRVHHD